MKRGFSAGLILFFILICGCTGYEYKPVPFKAAEAYPNHVNVSGAIIAAKAWSDKSEAKQAFGFDIRGADVLPVQLIVDNKGPITLTLIPDQTLVQDSENNLWPLLPARVVYERIEQNVKTARMGGEGARKAGLMGTAGAIIGAAIGIVSGGNVAQSTAHGAVIGGATGAVLGGAEGLNDAESQRRISSDLRNRSLQNQPLKPNQISHGFLFFPGEVKTPQILRLKLRDTKAKTDQIVELAIQPAAQ